MEHLNTRHTCRRLLVGLTTLKKGLIRSSERGSQILRENRISKIKEQKERMIALSSSSSPLSLDTRDNWHNQSINVLLLMQICHSLQNAFNEIQANTTLVRKS